MVMSGFPAIEDPMGLGSWAFGVVKAAMTMTGLVVTTLKVIM
jgi:hypothetical protein